jgi:hypothetical protein
VLFAVPQLPLTAVVDIVAEHDTVVPPLIPVQLHVQGPVPDTVPASPAAQRFVVGIAVRAVPFDVPHEPFVGTVETVAEHEAEVPPFVPSHVQAHGPEPVTAEAFPEVQKLVVGAAVSADALDVPHAPFTGVVTGGGVTTTPVLTVPTDIPLSTVYADVECL